MQVLSFGRLRDFWRGEPYAERPLRTWYKIASTAAWKTPAELKAAFGTNVDFIGDSRVIFDVGGNKYRIVSRVAYHPFYRMMIKFVGTHAEYDRINPETV